MAGAANGGKAGKLAMAEASMDSVQEAAQGRRRKVGLALGSGSARGWAHIGVLQELRSMGIQPDVVVGTSIGALVGAVYVSGQLDEFAQWVAGLGFRDVLGFLDIGFTGGMVKGEKLFSFFSEHQNNPHIKISRWLLPPWQLIWCLAVKYGFVKAKCLLQQGPLVHCPACFLRCITMAAGC